MQMLCFIIAIFYKNVNTKNKTKTHNKEHITPKYWYNIYVNKDKITAEIGHKKGTYLMQNQEQ